MGEMKSLILIICLILFIAGFVLGILLYQAREEIKQLRVERTALLGGVRWLKKEQARYRAGDLKIELTLSERRMIRSALEFPGYKEKVREPATKRFIRIIYNTLRTKIKESIKEQRGGG